MKTGENSDLGIARYSFSDLIGESPAMKNAIRLASIAADGDSTVLVTGESGTGKELFAQSIHSGSSRKNGPFVVLNCGAVPRDLVESLLFGYAPGTFTGGRKEGSAGAFEKSSGGTLFLDEIGEMPLSMQVKLLRVLQERAICRIGETREKPVNLRVIAATNRDLLSMVKSGDFREDLYWRLNVLEIKVPPLRARKDDVVPLAEFFLSRMAPRFGKRVNRLSEQAAEVFRYYSWPGNIRELENLLERETNMIGSEAEVMAHIPDRLLPVKNMPASAEYLQAQGQAQAQDNTFLSFEGIHLRNGIAGSHVNADNGNEKIPFSDGTVPNMQEIEGWAFSRALKITKGNITEAAKRLGIGRSTFYRRASKLNLLNDEEVGE